MSISLAALDVDAGMAGNHADIAEEAARLKGEAKSQAGSVLVRGNFASASD